MKKIAILIISTLLTHISCKKVNKENSKQKTATVKNLSVQEFKKLSNNKNAIILDVRTPEEIAQGKIKGSSNINYYDDKFKLKINLMDKNKEIYVYCKSGGRSNKAAQILIENGFKRVNNLKGGMMAWERANLPINKDTLAKDEHIKNMSLKEFESLINSADKVLVNFHTEWCIPCRKMAPIVDEIGEEYKGKISVLRVDMDRANEVGKKYEITGVPVFKVFQNGKVIWSHSGIISKKELKEHL